MAASRLVGWPAVLVLAAAGLVVSLDVRVITGANDIDSSGALIAAIALAVPIGLAGLGGLWCERAGVVNIGLEGMMILGTWGAAFFALLLRRRGQDPRRDPPWASSAAPSTPWPRSSSASTTSSPVWRSTCSVPAPAPTSPSRTFSELPGGSQTPVAAAAAAAVHHSPSRDGSPTSSRALVVFVSDIAGVLRALTTNLSVLTIIAVLLLVGTWWILWRTAFGLRLRSCGESPVAAETLGVNVISYKFIAVLISGGLAGLGGGFLALVASNLYREGQTAGRGYIGLAAMIFGNWRPGGLAAGRPCSAMPTR